MNDQLKLSEHHNAILKISKHKLDFGPHPYTFNLKNQTIINDISHSSLWTGTHLKITLISIEPNETTGILKETCFDQLFYVESGYGIGRMGQCDYDLNYEYFISSDDAMVIPVNTWYNIINTGMSPLKGFLVTTPLEEKETTKSNFKLSEHI